MNETFVIPGVPDATGTYVEALPERLEGARDLLPFWQAKSGDFLLRIPRVGAFRVQGGRSIEVAREADADLSAVAVYLHGVVRAALLQQRGELALHAACLVPPKRETAVAICGTSGMGKSTLAMELSRRGWRLLTDNLTRVQWQDGKALVWPSDHRVLLWRDACERFGIALDSLARVRRGVGRFYVDLSASDGQPVELGHVLSLRHGSEEGMERLMSASQRALLLDSHSFRRRQIAALGMQKEHAELVLRIVSRYPAGLLHGARRDTVEQLADRVEEALLWPDH